MPQGFQWFRTNPEGKWSKPGSRCAAMTPGFFHISQNSSQIVVTNKIRIKQLGSVEDPKRTGGANTALFENFGYFSTFNIAPISASDRMDCISSPWTQITGCDVFAALQSFVVTHYVSIT